MSPVSMSAWEWFTQLPTNERIMLTFVTIFFGCATLIVIVGVIAGTTTSIYRSRLETSLKRELLDRGLSPQEIAQIVNGSMSTKRSSLNGPSRPGVEEREHVCAS